MVDGLFGFQLEEIPTLQKALYDMEQKCENVQALLDIVSQKVKRMSPSSTQNHEINL